MAAIRGVEGYEYDYKFTLAEELIPKYSCGCKSKFALFEIRTSFIIRTIDGVDEPIDSETLDAQLEDDTKDESMTVFINMKLSCRLGEYWMTEAEIDEFDRKAVDFLRKAEAEDPSRAEIPILVTMEVRTVQQQGESISSLRDRAIRGDHLIPYFLCTGFSRIGAQYNMPDPFLTIFVMELPRNRVEDVEEGLEMMEACGICKRAPTIGAQISVLPQCGHSFHSHCVARHLLADTNSKTKLCPYCGSVAYYPDMPCYD